MNDHEHRTKETHPYECPDCDKLFATAWNLGQHAKDAHGKKPKREHDDGHMTEADYQTWGRL